MQCQIKGAKNVQRQIHMFNFVRAVNTITAGQMDLVIKTVIKDDV